MHKKNIFSALEYFDFLHFRILGQLYNDSKADWSSGLWWVLYSPVVFLDKKDMPNVTIDDYILPFITIVHGQCQRINLPI